MRIKSTVYPTNPIKDFKEWRKYIKEQVNKIENRKDEGEK